MKIFLWKTKVYRSQKVYGENYVKQLNLNFMEVKFGVGNKKKSYNFFKSPMHFEQKWFTK